jgi:hypothetical protein
MYIVKTCSGVTLGNFLDLFKKQNKKQCCSAQLDCRPSGWAALNSSREAENLSTTTSQRSVKSSRPLRRTSDALTPSAIC